MYSDIIKNLNKDKVPVLVAAHNVGALGVIYPLTKNNIDVIGISHEKFLIKNLDNRGILIEEKNKWFSEIKKIGKEYKNQNPDKKMIFLTDGDLTMDEMVDNYNEIKDLFILPIDENIDGYVNSTNKSMLPKVIKNVKLPKTYEGKEQYNIRDFPVLSKQISSYYRKPKEKVFISNNKDELLKNLKILEEIGGSVTQEMIEGGTESLYCITLYRNKYGHIIVGNIVQKIRELPIVNGTGCCHITVDNNKVLDRAIKVLEDANYTGIAMIEFKYSEKYDDYCLIEVNGRFPIETNINEKLDNNFILRIYNDMINKSEKKEVVFDWNEKKAYWVFTSYDVRSCIKKHINPFKEYKKYRNNNELVDAVRDYNDKVTYKEYKKGLVKKAYHKIIKL